MKSTDTIAVRLTVAQARALIGAFPLPLALDGDLAAAVRALQTEIDTAQVVALEGNGGETITDPDAAAVAARCCSNDKNAAELFFYNVGYQALLVLARGAGIKSGIKAEMTRAWCERLARAVREVPR